MAYTLMIILFVLGYLAITLEHSIRINKAALALITGVLLWTVLVAGGDSLLPDHAAGHAAHGAAGFFGAELQHHLADISEILFFLLGAMTVVELIDAHNGFSIITRKIRTVNKIKLLWLISWIAFFLSAVLDNLTTTIVMISLLRKLADKDEDRWFFAGMVIIAANAGGAWSPIGDVTTTMLWIGGHITAGSVVLKLLLPSVICLLLPLLVLSFTLRGDVQRPVTSPGNDHSPGTTSLERNLVFILGLLALIFVPVFKTLTHLPPYMGILLALGVVWVVTELLHRRKQGEEKESLSVVGVIRRIDTPSILFFLGILLAVSALQSAGHLVAVARGLKEGLNNVNLITLSIGVLSALVDNVPLVAAAIGMYPLETMPADAWASSFVVDGHFWLMLAYCAGTGGSVLIIGSAAGVAAMGLENISFFWYLKRISLLALLGYLAGAMSYIVLFG
jgi:Na+/H+ antiporter NhaD/arsenite permease-like protein